MYYLKNDVECPFCKHQSFKIEHHVEQKPDMVHHKDDIYLSWWEIYCTECLETIKKVEM